MKSPTTGKGSWRTAKRLLLALSLSSALMVTGCASNSQMPVCVPSRVTVDPSLMVKPSYQTELLNFLSDKPNEPTPK